MSKQSLAGGPGQGRLLKTGKKSAYFNARWCIEDMAKIDKKAKSLGITRSQLIRYATLEYGLKLKKADLPK